MPAALGGLGLRPGFRRAHRSDDRRKSLKLQINTERPQSLILIPQHFFSEDRIEIFDEDHFLVAFQHHEFVGIGELALSFVDTGCPRPA